MNQLHEQDSESVDSVDFVLDEERAFTLTGQLDLAVQDFGNVTESCGTSEGHIFLSGPGGVIAEVRGSQPSFEWNPPFPCTVACASALPLAASGVLAPGSYKLEARTDTAGQGIFAAHRKCNTRATGSYSADLVLAPTVPAIPVPLAALLGLALAGAARRRMRR